MLLLSKGKRVFVAIPAWTELRRSAALFRETHPEYHVRWLKQEHLHITLVPPWQCSDIEEVCRIVHEVAAMFPPVPLSFDTIAATSSKRKTRLIWAIGQAPDKLHELRRELQAKLGSAPDEREFLLHLTLARFSGREKVEFCSLPESVEWQGSLTSVTLYESILHPSGAEYRVLCDHPLPGTIQEVPLVPKNSSPVGTQYW